MFDVNFFSSERMARRLERCQMFQQCPFLSLSKEKRTFLQTLVLQVLHHERWLSTGSVTWFLLRRESTTLSSKRVKILSRAPGEQEEARCRNAWY